MKDNNKKKIAVKCEANVCPICGGMNLEYCGERVDDDDGCTYGWICKDCGASGREGYTLQFDGQHYDVKTGAGEKVDIVEPEAAPDPEDICPVCGGKLEYEDDSRFVKSYRMERDWRCSCCGAKGYASFEEECNYTFSDHDGVCLADGSVWDGKPIPATESAEKEHRITGSITLLNDFDMEDALLALAVANIGANEEHRRITIIDASVSAAVEALAREGILLQAITYEGNNTPVVVPPAPVKAATGWFVPVTWEMFGVVRIPFEDAPTLADAFKQIKDNPNIELPNGHYVDDSFAPSFEVEQIEEVRSLYNDNRPDAEV